MDRIREAVKEADVTLNVRETFLQCLYSSKQVTAVVGFAERDGASLYIAQATILPNGTIANHRRKIKVKSNLPTRRE